jgi:hypothetical protein
VYDAQRKIVEIVRKLEEAEEIVINGGGGDFEVIYKSYKKNKMPQVNTREPMDFTTQSSITRKSC